MPLFISRWGCRPHDRHAARDGSRQRRLASLSPAQAPLLLSLNGAMLYIGTALGAVGFARLAWVGVPFGLLALLTLAFDRVPASAAPSSSSAA